MSTHTFASATRAFARATRGSYYQKSNLVQHLSLTREVRQQKKKELSRVGLPDRACKVPATTVDGSIATFRFVTP